MAADSQDVFKKVGASTVTSLSAPGKALSATTLTVGSTTGYPTDTGIVIGIRQVDSAGDVVAGTYTEWNGTVTSATGLAINATPVYGTDQVYPAGSTTQVFLNVSSSLHNQLIDGLLVSLDQDGTLKAGAVDNAAVLASNVVTTAKILDANVTTAKIADDNVTSAKLAQTFFKGRYQSSTTNSDQSGITVQFGWGFIAGSGTGVATKAITFPTAYTTPLAVIISSAGYRSGSDPTDITQLDDGEGGEIVHRQTFDVITTGFTAKLIAEQGRNLGASTVRYGFTWISFGIV